MADPIRLQRAAESILTRSFGLQRDQNLLIFADPDAREVVELMTRSGRRLGIAVSTFYISRFLQADMGSIESLPLPIESAIRDADAVLSCLSDRPEHLNYRLRVLRTSWSRRIKLAHAPGMTLDILEMADTDYGFIKESGQVLAQALILGKRLHITTHDWQGNDYKLDVEIGGWNFPPGISDGIITEGTWANLPPGEVYIVPQNGEGQVVINGSMPARVLEPGENLVLTFRSGRLIDWQPGDGTAARHFYETQVAYAEKRGDPNWTNLAEIGFGLNPAVSALVGVELVDEKKAGTLHIALGHSLSLGGNVDSVIHCDLVVERPTVHIDGKTLLESGHWRASEADWRLDHRTAPVSGGWWERVSDIRRSGIRAIRDHERLVCQWNSGRGRIDSTKVGVEYTARLAAKLYDLIPENGASIHKEDLIADAERQGLEPHKIPGLLWVMREYDLVRLSEGQVP